MGSWLTAVDAKKQEGWCPQRPNIKVVRASWDSLSCSRHRLEGEKDPSKPARFGWTNQVASDVERFGMTPCSKLPLKKRTSSGKKRPKRRNCSWLNHPFLSKLDHFSRDRAENKKCLKSSPSSLLGLAEVVRSVPLRQEGEKKNHFFVGHSWLPWRVMYLPCFVEYINIQWCVLKRVLLPDLILSLQDVTGTGCSI